MMTNEEMLAQISEMLQAQDTRVAEMLDTQKVQITLMIENTVTKRLDALYDAYMLTHEKQLELEREFISLGERVERLEVLTG